MPSGLFPQEASCDTAGLVNEGGNVDKASPVLVNCCDSIQSPQVYLHTNSDLELPKTPQKLGLLSRRRGKMALSMEMPPVKKLVSPLTLLDDKFKVLEKLGSGCAGMVHRAVCLESGRTVALKIPRSKDAGLAEAAQKEYDLLTRLGPHPNIIKVLGFHNLKGEATLVLEFFDGPTLQAVVQEKRLPEPTARILSIGLLKAAGHLHANNILHRDIKPQNVLVGHCLQKLRLCDFNAAACLDDGVPLTPTGTELYKAPELLLGEFPCERSDVWACGLCIYFMLSGSLPQGRDTLDPFCKLKADVALQPISLGATCWQHISEECKAMLQQCLAVSREDRPMIPDLLYDAWISDPIMRSLNLISWAVPGAQAYLSVLTTYLSADAMNAEST